jgi:hypothetical protein
MRGLPQVGLVLSAIWIALIGMLAWGRVASPNLTTEAYLYLPKGGTTPKGIIHFLTSIWRAARRPIFVLSILTTTVCLVPHIRKCKRPTGSLYPVDERNSRRVDGVHAKVLRSPHGELQALRVSAILSALAAMLMPPLVVLIIGAAFLWAFSGCKRSA